MPPRYDTDAKRGAAITRVLEAQRELVLRHFGHLAPQFIHNTWMEGNRLVQEGHTRVPEGVHVVWSNNGYGSFRSMVAEGCRLDQIKPNLPDDPPPGEHGVYYHVAVGDGCAPYSTQIVPASRIERSFKQVLDRKMTAYLLVNVGQVTTCTTSVAAVADLWNTGEKPGVKQVMPPGVAVKVLGRSDNHRDTEAQRK